MAATAVPTAPLAFAAEVDGAPMFEAIGTGADTGDCTTGAREMVGENVSDELPKLDELAMLGINVELRTLGIAVEMPGRGMPDLLPDGEGAIVWPEIGVELDVEFLEAEAGLLIEVGDTVVLLKEVEGGAVIVVIAVGTLPTGEAVIGADVRPPPREGEEETITLVTVGVAGLNVVTPLNVNRV
jgi:hypothetical protein